MTSVPVPVLELERQEALLAHMHSAPHEAANVAMARIGVSRSELQRWKRNPDFLIRWNELSRSRSQAPRLPAPRRASDTVVRQVLAAFESDPSKGVTAHCRAVGTTRKLFEMALDANPGLKRIYEAALDALAAPVEEVQIQTLRSHAPGAAAARTKWLAKNVGGMWGESAAPAPTVVRGDVNLQVVMNAPKAPVRQGIHAPVDVPARLLRAADQLPSIRERREKLPEAIGDDADD